MQSIEPIRSAQNPRLKRVRALRRGRERDAVLLEGARVIDEAGAAGVIPEFVLHAPDPGRTTQAALTRWQAAGWPVLAADAALLRAEADRDAVTDVVAVAARPASDPAALLQATRASGGLLLVAAGIQDPGNAGALVRVAAALGASGALFLRGGASPWHPRAVRGASGTSFRLPLAEGWDAAQLLEAAASVGLPLWVTAAEAEDYRRLSRPASGCALVLGEEGGGVDPLLRAGAACSLGIPLQREVESLNVATAAAILVAALAAGEPA